MRIIPKGKRLYVEFDPVEEKKLASGIIMPDKHREPTRIGTVIAIGPDVDQYEVGDRVMAAYIAGTDIYYPDEGFVKETHRIISQENLLCKVEE